MSKEEKTFTARQSQIMEAALEVIAEQGIQGMTMKAIGHRLHMTDAALYRHFKGKKEIFSGITDLFASSSNRMLQAIVDSDPSGMAQMRNFYLDRCREFSAHRGMALVMFSEELFRKEKRAMNRYYAIMAQHKQALLASIRQGQKQGEIKKSVPPEHVFLLVMGSLRLLVTQWRGQDFAFDLTAEGQALWQTLESLLKEER